MKQAVSIARSREKPAGESWVWVASLGLAVGLTMIVLLLGMIFYRGLEVFWPKPVALIQLNPGSVSGIGQSRIVAGEITKQQDKRVPTSGEGDGTAAETEWQLFVGNKDVYGFSFKYVNAAEVESVDHPSSLMVAERVEYGRAIFTPLEIRGPGAEMLPATHPDFHPALERLIDEGNQRRGQIERIERAEIGAINREMEELRLRRRAVEERGSSSADASQIAEMDARVSALQEQYELLAAEARRLRALQDAWTLAVRTPDGQERAYSLGGLMGVYHPNQLSPFEKCGMFLHRFWIFLSEQPREANTEGGIFPAIFGTFVMTLLMSAAVTPFGVLAAIYLREYAQQGVFVRAVRIAVNNLAGVPSIVFGVFGLGFFVYFVGGSIDQLFYSLRLPTPTFGTGGILWASLTLALMTVPVVIVATEEALAAVSRGAREGSLACGASKWQTIQRIVLPASLPGILTGLILAMARGAGEVAPLMLVGVVKLAPALPIDGIYPFVHLERKFMHLGFHIFDLGFQSPDSEAAQPMVFATTFLLILLVILLNLGAIFIRNHLRRKYRGATF